MFTVLFVKNDKGGKSINQSAYILGEFCYPLVKVCDINMIPTINGLTCQYKGGKMLQME